MLKKIVKSLLSQSTINKFYHLPKAILANIIYGFPTRGLTVIGVTGTDGKTTTVNMIYQILKQADKKVSMISSINAVVGGKTYDTGFHVTSPDPFMVQQLAKKSLKHGDKYLVLEVTSHALDQFRFWGIQFNVGVITNITHEHLDYHKSFENYKNTKLKLIKMAKHAVVNPRKVKLKLKIAGNFNIENAQMAMAVAEVLGIDQSLAKKSVENFEGLAGRMEEVKNSRGIKIIIDFAHTPNGLEKALNSLRRQTKGKLIAVFGAASQRDVLKRPMMGKISAKLSDITILTDEDPRYEDRSKIINEIADGAYKMGAKDGISLFKEVDREKAIKMAISLTRKGDIVGIFGKGHEKSINYQGVEKPWSDREAVEKALHG